MNKKVYIIIFALVVLLIFSQWLAVKLVYSDKIGGDLAIKIAKTYKLKAVTLHKNDITLEVYLDEFLKSKEFVGKILAIKDSENGESLYSLNEEDDIDAVVWDNVIKKAWLENITERHNIEITQAELNEALNIFEHQNFLELSKQYNWGISREDYIKRVIEPMILESKVYVWLLDNFNDFDGIQKAQLAYESLESGRDFSGVVDSFSDEKEYSKQVFWLQEEDLVGHFEPIKYLEPGEFTKIVVAPGPNGVYYTIWRLESKTDNEENTAYGVKGIYIKARSLDQFFADFLVAADINYVY